MAHRQTPSRGLVGGGAPQLSFSRMVCDPPPPTSPANSILELGVPRPGAKSDEGDHLTLNQRRGSFFNKKEPRSQQCVPVPKEPLFPATLNKVTRSSMVRTYRPGTPKKTTFQETPYGEHREQKEEGQPFSRSWVLEKPVEDVRQDGSTAESATGLTTPSATEPPTH